jgi:hypothetical protein
MAIVGDHVASALHVCTAISFGAASITFHKVPYLVMASVGPQLPPRLNLQKSLFILPHVQPAVKQSALPAIDMVNANLLARVLVC